MSPLTLFVAYDRFKNDELIISEDYIGKVNVTTYDEYQTKLFNTVLTTVYLALKDKNMLNGENGVQFFYRLNTTIEVEFPEKINVQQIEELVIVINDKLQNLAHFRMGYGRFRGSGKPNLNIVEFNHQIK